MSIEVQYTIIGVIMIAAIVWGGIAMRRIVRGKKSCCGCSLKDSCCGKNNAANKKDTCCDKKNAG